MRRRLECPKPSRLHHAEIQRRWRWFRRYLPAPLWYEAPVGFGPEEGDFEVTPRMDPEAQRSLNDASEHDQASKKQTLRYRLGASELEVEVHRSAPGDDYQFHLRDGDGHIRFFASTHEAYVELDEGAPTFARWAEVAGFYRLESPELVAYRCPTCRAERGVVEEGMSTTHGNLATPASDTEIEVDYRCLECDDAFYTVDEYLPSARSVISRLDGAAFELDRKTRAFEASTRTRAERMGARAERLVAVIASDAKEYDKREAYREVCRLLGLEWRHFEPDSPYLRAESRAFLPAVGGSLQGQAELAAMLRAIHGGAPWRSFG
jgi:DNA-directed RNA polymerase subunit RPC12/RpoP